MTIEVQSHVARDFLQSAAYFNTVPKVVWEYVSNSIDNPRPGSPVSVSVHISRAEITIEDNGSGMSRQDLARFFQMHGENQARGQGRAVRGRFGTGKSAAFGIASILQVDTVKDGLRNLVTLDRQTVEQAKDGKPFSVSQPVVDEPTGEESGTRIKVQGIHVGRIDVDGSRRYIEQQLRRQHQAHSVVVNGHACESRDLPFIQEYSFTTPPDLVPKLGTVVLTIRVSPQPLDSEDHGILIFSRGLMHEQTLSDQAGKPYTDSIFGEVDVPALEDEQGPIGAFDNTRSNQLNRANETVVVLLAWISQSITEVRDRLAKEDRERRATEQARQLEEQADQISSLLNEDFKEFERELRRAQAAARAAERAGSGGDEGSTEVLVTSASAGQLPPPVETSVSGIRLPPGGGKEPNPVGGQSPPGKEGEVPAGQPHEDAPGRGAAVKRPTSRSGFRIEFRNMSEAAFRSRYVRDSRTILINLDHPLVRAAKDREGGIRGPFFRQLSQEIALTEYAFALCFELAQQEGEAYTAYLALNDALATVNRVSKLIARA